MIYEYKCPTHPAVRVDSEQRGDRHRAYCDFCQDFIEMHRVFSVAVKPAMQEHFNRTVNKPISSMRQFRDALNRANDEAAQPSTYLTADGEKVTVPGIEQRMVPVEWGDKAAFGATGEGIDESNRQRSKLGMPLLPEIS